MRAFILLMLLSASVAQAEIYRITGTNPVNSDGTIPDSWQMIVAVDPDNLNAITLMAKNVPDQAKCSWEVLAWPNNLTYECLGTGGPRIDLYGITADYISNADSAWATYDISIEPYSINALVGAWSNPVMSARLRPITTKKPLSLRALQNLQRPTPFH